MTEPAAPATPQEAAAVLSTRTADAAWGGKLIAGDVATMQEFQMLTKLASNVDASAEALAGKLSSPSTVEQHVLVEGLAELRSLGLGEDVIQSVVVGAPVTRAEHDAVKRLQAQKLNDQGWVKALLEGNLSVRKELALMSVVLSADIKREDAA